MALLSIIATLFNRNNNHFVLMCRSVHGGSRLANGSQHGGSQFGGGGAVHADSSSRSGKQFFRPTEDGGDIENGFKPLGYTLPGQGGPLQDNAGVSELVSMLSVMPTTQPT